MPKMYSLSPIPLCHSGISKLPFLAQNGLWRLGLWSVVLVEQKKKQYLILSKDEIKKVKIIAGKILWWEMKQSLLELKEAGIHVIQPSPFTDEYPGVHKGKWFVQGCYVMNLCQSSSTRVLALCSIILDLFSGTTWEKTNSPSTQQLFKYLVTVVPCPQDSSLD